jgi:hypothetical protein
MLYVPQITEATAEIAARVGGEQAGKEIILPLADLPIGAALWNSAMRPAPPTSGILAGFRACK